MRISDYDHDGVASEFLVQVSGGRCGHTGYAAVGAAGGTISVQRVLRACSDDGGAGAGVGRAAM